MLSLSSAIHFYVYTKHRFCRDILDSGKIKSLSTITFSVGELQMSVRELQLPALPPQLFLTHKAAGMSESRICMV